ncbi:MAG: minor capsid protein [Chloroflexi bacterium]|nr:minor capsid protein [Chloroflexota bacterium]
MPIDSTFWENEKRRLLAIFLPRLTQMALTGMTTAAKQAGISFDNTLYNQRAEAWARTYTDQLLADLGTTTQTIVGTTVADWIAKPNMTVGDLDAVLTPVFGATRANAIAVTETTRAFANGQIEAYKAEGIEEMIWRTNKDALVCPVCGPLNNKVAKIGEAFGKDKNGNDITQPPGHPRCRCWVAPKVSKDKPKEQAKDNQEISGDTRPLPQSLGADVFQQTILKTQRYNELVSINQQQQKILLENMLKPNKIPEMNYHSKWFENVGVSNAKDYQSKFEMHLQNNQIRMFTGIQDGEKVWYLVDLEDGYLSAYNESRSQHYTFLRKPVEEHIKFLEATNNWLVEVKRDEDKIRILHEWQP